MANTVDDLADIDDLYSGATANVVVGDYSLGEYPLAIEGDPPDGPYTVGLMYETRIEPMPPAIDGPEGPMAGDLIRIAKSHVNVLGSSRFAQNGFELAAYQVTDDLSAAPPLRTGWRKFSHLGRSTDPSVFITQPDPLPLTVLAIKNLVVY
jgi:hypothetical protein